MAPVQVRLFYDDGPAYQDSVRTTIRDAATFAAAWDSITGGGIEVPQVDFQNDLVVVVAAGEMTPEDQIRVDSVGVGRIGTQGGDTEETLDVLVVTTTGCGRFRTPAYPREVVLVRRFEGLIRFVERPVRETNC